jgi:DNA-binding NtrC family response regulator
MMTAFTSSETAVDAMKNGAYDYISEYFETEDVKLIANNTIGKNF